MLPIALKYNLNDFRHAEMIGSGSFGNVFEVISAQNRCFKYAVKEVLKDFEKFKVEEELHRELTIAASKTSQRCHVIKFLGAANGTCLETGVSWSRIFLELAPKQTLADHISSNGYASHIALCTFQEIISGLLFIHSLEIVHGDIKPCNILMDKRYKAKIADFGLSRRQVGTTKTKAPGYTRAYAAPEVLRKVPTDGYAADSWAATMTLFVMLTGQNPWGRAESKNSDYLAWTQGETLQQWAILDEDEKGFLRRNLGVL